MLQQDASATRPYRGLVFDTCALAVSKLGCTNLIFVQSGAKLNGQYYRDMLLMQKLLPEIHSIAGDVFVFQQDNVPAHRARDRVELLRSETPQFISPDMWPANSRDLSPVDNRVWGMLQERMYRVPIHDTDELWKHLVATWADFQQSVADNAVDQWRRKDWKHVSVQNVVTLNTCCDIACLTFQLPHITTSSFQSHHCLQECNITFSQMKKFSILQGSVVTFFRCGG